MTDEEVTAAAASNTYLNLARQAFRKAWLPIPESNYHGFSEVELLRMEFEGVKEIAAVLGLNLMLTAVRPKAKPKERAVEDLL